MLKITVIHTSLSFHCRLYFRIRMINYWKFELGILVIIAVIVSLKLYSFVSLHSTAKDTRISRYCVRKMQKTHFSATKSDMVTKSAVRTTE